MSACARWRIAPAVLAGLLGASAAVGETVGVRTADHVGFTRIVLDFADRPSWQLGRAGEGYELRTGRPSIRYDLNGAYRRIGRDRVAAIRSGNDGTLALELACDCALSVQELPNQGLVIDIRDGAPAAGNPFEVALDAATPAGLLDLARLTAPRQTEPLIPGALSDALRPNTAGAARRQQATMVRAAVNRSIERGVKQDIVAVRDADASEAGVGDPLAALDGLPNLRIATPGDREPPGSVPHGQAACVDRTRLAVADWGTPDLRQRWIGAARTSLVDLQGRPDPAAHAALAMQYIYLTFGAEAESLLDSAPPDTPDRALLRDVARIVDGRPVDPDSALRAGRHCDDEVALWQALVDPSAGFTYTNDGAAVARAFDRLPPHLRRHLGPRLVDRALTAGKTETALLLRNALTRGRLGGAAASLPLARLDAATGNDAAAADGLADVAGSNGPDAARAVLALVDRRIAADAAIGSDLRARLDAQTYLAADPGLLADLTGARMRAAAHDGDIVEGFALYDDAAARELVGAADRAALEQMLYAELVSIPDDATFISILLPRLDRLPLPDESRITTATRLIDLGLADQARAVIGAATGVPQLAERHALARIALLDRRPAVATSYLAGLADDRSLELLRRARDMAVLVEMPPAADVPRAEPESGTPLALGRQLLDESRDVSARLEGLFTE